MNKTNNIKTFNIENGYDYYEHLKANAENRIRTWAIKWYASIFLKKGLSLHPYPSLTNNIGHDGQGVHIVQNDMYLWKEIAQSIEVVPQPLVESTEARKAFASFFQKRHFKVKQYEGYYKKQIKKMIFKFIPKSVSDKYYAIRNKNIVTLSDLKLLERHKDGEFKYNQFKLHYTDSLSLYNEIVDIFEDRIYYFKTNNPKPTIIDAGSCIGVSILYFKQLYPLAKIYGFEPDKNIYSVLKKNIEQNHLTDVEILNFGLGKTVGILKFYPDNSDGGSVVEEQNKDSVVEISIKTLSSYLNEPIDLLKMNIEGMESDVFEEIESKLSNVNEIILEYHCFDNLKQTLGNILNILDRQGFRYVVTDATNAKIPIPFNLKKNYKYFNLVYAKRIDS